MAVQGARNMLDTVVSKVAGSIREEWSWENGPKRTLCVALEPFMVCGHWQPTKSAATAEYSSCMLGERVRSSPMTDTHERLKQLAETAANEQDLHKFTALVREINLVLEEKQERLARLRIPSKPSE
jgi:hypothetical protein